MDGLYDQFIPWKEAEQFHISLYTSKSIDTVSDSNLNLKLNLKLLRWADRADIW